MIPGGPGPQRAAATSVRRAQVAAGGVISTARALAAALAPQAGELVLVFVGGDLDPDQIAPALAAHLAPATVVGCTSSGEIAGPVTRGTLVAVAFGAPALRAAVALADNLSAAPMRTGHDAVVRAAAQLGLTPDALTRDRHVILTLHDGHATSAEAFCLGTAAAAPQLEFVGGVASIHRGAKVAPAVFAGGRAHRDAGLVIVLDSALPFEVLCCEHMQPTPLRTVVTAVDPTGRWIRELDGYPAAQRWRAMITSLGATAPITTTTAARFPFATYVGDRPYVRSIVELGPVMLQVAAAVDAGSVLRIMKAGDLVASTRAALDGVRARLGPLAAVIAFSCIARHTESDDRGHTTLLDQVYASQPVCGFHSFGEQIGPLLVNHTLAALAVAQA